MATDALKKWHGAVAWIVRCLLAWPFLMAGWSKLQDPVAFERAIAQYQLIGPEFGRLIARTLPPMEILIGVGLFCGPRLSRLSTLAAAALLGVFTAVLAQAGIRRLDIRECGCGELLTPIDLLVQWTWYWLTNHLSLPIPQSMIRNVLYLGIAFAVYCLVRRGWPEPAASAPSSALRAK